MIEKKNYGALRPENLKVSLRIQVTIKENHGEGEQKKMAPEPGLQPITSPWQGDGEERPTA